MIRVRRPDILTEIPLDQPAVIEASAGTGKTFTLEHLVLEMMLSRRIPISNILVVTFTERATNELRQRIRAMLEEILTGVRHEDEIDPDASYWEIDEDMMRFVERQLFTFDRAPIHTIHGFCNRILAENAFHLRRLFDQEQQDSRALFEEAFRSALRTDLTTDAVLASYTEAWFTLYDRKQLESDLYRVCDRSGRILPGFSAERLLFAIEEFRKLDADVEQVAASIRSRAMRNRQQWEMEELAVGIRRFFELLPAVSTPADIPHFLAELDPWLTQMRQEAAQHNDPAVKAAYYIWYRLAPLRVVALQHFRPVVQRHLADAKSRGLFDFDDMLALVWDRLSETGGQESPLLGYLREQYQVALIDEFQDTDPVQWNIFRTVFYEGDHENGLYLIGDPKQAIYGFRGADVHTYLAARDIVEEGGKRLALRENFRSTGELIEAYNVLFDQSAERPFFVGPIVYDAPVSCGRPDLSAKWANGDDVVPIEVVQPVADGLYKSRIRDAITENYAEEIERILTDGSHLVVGDGEAERRVTASDIFVLTHSNWEGREVARALRRRGIPHSFYKNDGLFQSDEAHDILDLLAAIEAPYDPSKRQLAWVTPFFEVPLADLPRCRELPETHPLFAQLIAWNDLAQRHEFERLFTDIIESSGIVRRAIFLGRNDRAITDVQHIFEVLLDEVNSSRLDLAELLARLQSFVTGQAFSISDDRNVQRLENDDDAVQIMTVHKSKGLEADVVFLFGGFYKPKYLDIFSCRVEGEPAIHVGKPYLRAPRELIDRETFEESQRLLYVATTRARAKIYLPYVESRDVYRGQVDGRHAILNERLRHIFRGKREGVPGFQWREAHWAPIEEPEPAPLPIERWSPDLTPSEHPVEAAIEGLREEPLLITSYSRMKRTASKEEEVALGPAAFNADLHQGTEAWRSEEELPGGAPQGIFLHALFEHLPPHTFAAESIEAWRVDESVSELYGRMHREHGIDERYRPHAEQMVWNTMTAPVALPDGNTSDGLWTASRVLHEVEFFFPIPEEADPKLDDLADDGFEVRRGFIKGYIDTVLEFDSGRVYFVDWKSDTLESYDDGALATHVAANYATQARLYSLAIARMFGLHDEASYADRFGGYLYAFLRGADGEGAGFHVHRPTFDELLAYEGELVTTDFL